MLDVAAGMRRDWECGMEAASAISRPVLETEITDMDIPSCGDSLDINLPAETLHLGARHLCKILVKGWASLEDRNLIVSTITGGLTNQLLQVSVQGEPTEVQCVTVRIFGPNTDVIIDRQRELQAVFHLSAAGFGAKLFGVFKNGMVQSFIDARTLHPPDLSQPHFMAIIAKELRRFHDVEVPGSTEPQLWVDIMKFLDTASSISFKEINKQKMFQKISFGELREECDALKKLCKSLDAPVVFAHNDLLSGNIMYNDERGELYLIDYEYGCYNYRGYDIGNHFNEYGGLECDFSLYPSKKAQFDFFRNYLCSDCTAKASESELKTLFVETNCYSLASHLFWAVCGLIQAKNSPIEFDYLGYFFLRYNEYKRRKDEVYSLVQEYQATQVEFLV